MAESDEPLLVLVELLGRRFGWSLIWALRHGAQPFTTLVQVTGAGENTASQRLRELRNAGLVEIDEGGHYRLTGHGRRALDPIESLATFAEGWAALTPRQRVPRGSADRGYGES